MPEPDGFETARILAERRRDLVIVLMSADRIDPPAWFAPRGGEIIMVGKQDLSPRLLLDLWHGRRTR